MQRLFLRGPLARTTKPCKNSFSKSMGKARDFPFFLGNFEDNTRRFSEFGSQIALKVKTNSVKDMKSTKMATCFPKCLEEEITHIFFLYVTLAEAHIGARLHDTGHRGLGL